MASCQPVTHAHIMFHKLKGPFIGFASKEFGKLEAGNETKDLMVSLVN